MKMFEKVKKIKVVETKVKPQENKVEVSTIKEYIQLDKEIASRENSNCQHLLTFKQKVLQNYDNSLTQLIKFYESCVKEVTKKNPANDTINSVHTFLDSHFSFDDELNAKQLDLNEEQEDLLDELNRLEIAKKDLDSLTEHKRDLEDEVKVIKIRIEDLKKKYTSQDQLLGICFGGKYGSKREQKLESELDKCIEKKQRIQLSHFKWRTAKLFAQYAGSQIEVAISRWQEIGLVPAGQIEKRYTLTTDVRNYLVCAIQNLINAQTYLSKVTFPYCTSEEVDTLYIATVSVYSDVQTLFRHAYALQCFTTTHRRVQALVKWFDSIINKDMTKDLQNAFEEVEDLILDLREERVRIMVKKARENSEEEPSVSDFDVEEENKKMFLPDIPESQISHAPESENDKGNNARKILVSLMNVGDNLETGVHSIKKQHQRDVEILTKAQKVNKMRMEEGLHEKLQKRRQSRLLQLQELSQSVDKSMKHLRNVQPVINVKPFEEDTDISMV